MLVAQRVRHAALAEQAGQSVERHRREPRLRDRRRIRLARRAFAVGDGDQLDAAALDVRLHDRERADIALDAALAEIGQRPDHVAIRHAGDVEAGALEVAVEDDVGHAGRGRIVQLARLGADHVDEVLDRIDLERRRHDEADQRVGYAGDRRQLGRIVGQLGVLIRMRGERRGRRVEQRVVVLGADEGIDGDHGIAARTVLDHDRLLPFRGELVRDQARADVGAAAGAERHDEADRALRPSSAPVWAIDGTARDAATARPAASAQSALPNRCIGLSLSLVVAAEANPA